MHTAKRGRRLAALAVCGALLLAGMLPGLPAAALDGFSKGRLSIITEPGAVSDKVSFYKDGKEQGASAMTWVDGRDGKALLLDGKTEYPSAGLRAAEDQPVQLFYLDQMAGGPGRGGGGRPIQPAAVHLFPAGRAMAGFQPLCPGRLQAEGGREPERHLSRSGLQQDQDPGGNAFRAVQPCGGRGVLRLPEGTWHQVAVVSDEHSMKVYIDGTLWFDDPLLMSMVELQALTMKIGAAYDGGRCLHAELDDTALYEVALTADQIGMMAGGVDPFADGASMPPSTAPYIPTAPAPVSSEVSGTGDEDDRPATVFGFPVAGLVIMGGVVVVFAGLSILLSVRASKNNGGPKGGGRA